MDFKQFILEEKSKWSHLNYSTLNDISLIGFFSTFWVWGLWCAMRILITSLPLQKAYKHTHHIANRLTDADFEHLYSIYPHTKPLAQLVFLRCSIEEMCKELTKRTNPYARSREILRYRLRKPNAPWMLPLLKFEESGMRKTYRPYAEDTEDREMLVIKAVEKCHRKLGRNALGKLNYIPLPDPLFPDPSEWDLPLAARTPKADAFCFRILRDRIKISLRDLLPILNGDLEKRAPEYVRQTLRSHNRKSKRRENKRAKSSPEELEGYGKLHREGQITKGSSPEPWEVEGLERTHKILSEDSIQQISDGLDGKKALDIIQTRPANQRRFWAVLKETRDIKKASKAADVSRQMGHRWVLEIRRKLTQGTPQKKKK